jgi:predicted enzyme related to lactoylglutathione lyase
MPSAAIVRRISPMLAVANMDESIAFYQNVLGFAIAQQSPEYSVIERDGQTIHLQRAASDEIVKILRNHVEIYIEVSGIQQLWQHVQSFKDRYRLREVFDRDYGMTEFHVIDPNSCLVFVGERTDQVRASAKPAG